MFGHLTKGSILVGSTALVVVAIGALVRLDARAHAADGSALHKASPATPTPLQPTQDLPALRRQIEQAVREVSDAKTALNQILFERIKSIKRRRGLTPAEAQAFDDAYAAELARINRLEQQLNAALKQLDAREQALPHRAPVRATGTTDAAIVKRLEALERRVEVLEDTIAK